MTREPLRLDGLSVEAGGRALVRALSLTVGAGEVVGLVGPNGSGKSTALRCVYRALRPTGGTVWLDGRDLADMPLRESARGVAALSQESGTELDFTVEEIVALGRTPHLRGNQPLSARERALCREAMRRLDVLHLADRGVLTLSGGERQRVLAARALVQEAGLLVLDEPTNHLDIRHQVALLGLLRDPGLTVLVVLHDLNLAAAVCDRIAVLEAGALVAVGTPREVVTEELVAGVFGVAATVVPHPLTGDPQLLYTLNSSTAPAGAAEAVRGTPESRGSRP
ncbi:iron complex transport system ATP-binding protein [Streptomyces zhaozhouensis]|uniref:Iron complex transport system ATP-binding protein n=1 Tax=Streptomyces zhaozhouensis TaxID=1300267 RepID=A0A286DWB5_9ACTN|nr:ABC transporter ATP-binding protein [Streptomyces zhaozhouensis]SOD62969.1 iron complex transport system ATP-binding protein [Streptomyces zhaozhouensis]